MLAFARAVSHEVGSRNKCESEVIQALGPNFPVHRLVCEGLGWLVKPLPSLVNLRSGPIEPQSLVWDSIFLGGPFLNHEYEHLLLLQLTSICTLLQSPCLLATREKVFVAVGSCSQPRLPDSNSLVWTFARFLPEFDKDFHPVAGEGTESPTAERANLKNCQAGRWGP